MKRTTWLYTLATILALSGTSTTESSAGEVAPTAYQSADEGTLPPVEVRPEPQTSLPPVNVDAPPLGDGAPTVGDLFDLPDSYPSLRDQQYDSFENGALRGLPKSLFDTPSNNTIVDQATIREKQAASVLQALQFENSVLVQQTGRGQSSIFLRGVTGQQVLLLVDGVRVNNSTLRAGPNQYSALFDPGSIDRFEIVRGSQSVMWGGDAIGGAINIVTRGADPNRGDYAGTNFIQYLSSADDGSYSRGSIEGWVGQQGVFTGGSYLDVANLDRGGGLGPQPFTEYSQYSGDVKYNYILSDDDLLTVTMQHFEQHDVPRSDRFQPFVSQNIPNASGRPTFFDPQQRDLVYLRLQGNGYNAFYDAYSHTASWQRNKEGTSELQGTALTVGEFDVNTLGYTLTLMKDFEQFGMLSYGGEYYNDEINSVRSRRPNAASPFVPVASAQYPDDATYDRAGVYGLWDVQLTERMNVFVGGRYENVNAGGTPLVTLNNVSNVPFAFERTYQDFVGSLGYVYELDEEWHFVGGVYEGFRAPTVDDLTADKTFLQTANNVPTVGSLNVQPEHSTTYEVGLKLDAPRLRGQLFQWYMNLDDYITRIPDANNVVVLGNSNAALHGTELSGEFLVDTQWSLYGNIFYTWGRDTLRNEPYPRIPPTQGVTGVRWRDESRLSYVDLFTWMVADFDRDRYSPSIINNQGLVTDARFPNGGQPGFATLNLRMGRTFGEAQNHLVSLSLMNITDKYYRVVGSGVDGEGFNAILGYEFRQ